MSQVPPGHRGALLPVADLIVEAWRLVFERFGQFAFLGAAPALALCGLVALRAIVAGPDPSALWLLGEQLMWTFVWASVGVSWQRLVLLGRAEKARWGELPFEAREARFFLYALATRAPGVIVVLLMSHGDPEAFEIPIFLLGTAQVVLAIMFPLVFPAAATDRDRGFAGAWRLLRSSALRLFAASLLAALPVFMLVIPLSYVAAGDAGVLGQVLIAPFEVIPVLAAEGIVAVVIALAYRRLTESGGALAPTTRAD